MKRWLVLALLCSPAFAAVAVDAHMATGNSADGLNQEALASTTISSTGITVGASATCLVGVLTLSDSGAPNGAATMTWNGVSMTKHSEATTGIGPFAYSAMFVLVSPASGAQTLTATWTGSHDSYMSAVSFTGTDTTTCVNAAHDVTATGTTSITITSTTDGATVANFAVNGSAPAVNFTKLYADAPNNPGGGGSYTLGGTSNAHTFTGSGGTVQALSGVHVIAAASTAGPNVGFKGKTGIKGKVGII